MDTVTKRLYEAMFLVDTAQATADWDQTVKAIETVLERAEADVLSVRKWDERRLEYPIKKTDRGTYFIAYFKAPTSSIVGLERDVQLSEIIMRVLVLRGDHLTAEDMQKDTPAMVTETNIKKIQEKTQQQEEQSSSAQQAESTDNQPVSEVNEQ